MNLCLCTCSSDQQAAWAAGFVAQIDFIPKLHYTDWVSPQHGHIVLREMAEVVILMHCLTPAARKLLTDLPFGPPGPTDYDEDFFSDLAFSEQPVAVQLDLQSLVSIFDLLTNIDMAKISAGLHERGLSLDKVELATKQQIKKVRSAAKKAMKAWTKRLDSSKYETRLDDLLNQYFSVHGPLIPDFANHTFACSKDNSNLCAMFPTMDTKAGVACEFDPNDQQSI